MVGVSQRRPSSEWLISLSAGLIITVLSLTLMLSYTSPELSWDEAAYAANTATHWGVLWGSANYTRHFHGPMAIYLAKLGQERLPAGIGSPECRLRFFAALIGSVAVGFLFWAFRYFFGTSWEASLVGTSLLLFSVIRIKETNIIGPHHLMLACVLGIVTLGYYWRQRPTLQAAVGLGVMMAWGALSMTYVIPAALCWAVAVALAGAGWITWDRTHLKISWKIAVILITAAIIVTALWFPGVRQLFLDLRALLNYGHHPTLVRDRIFESTPRWAAAYWLAYLEAPLVSFSLPIIIAALWMGLRKGRLWSKHAYIAICLVFFSGTALTAYLAGARNLLPVIGVLCVAIGALFDEALDYAPRLVRLGLSAGAVALAALNFIWLSHNPRYIPYLATDGYRAFVRAEGERLNERCKALVSGLPVLSFYAHQHGSRIAWDVSEVPWTTQSIPLPPDVKYVLMPEFVYKYMPPQQPMRGIIAERWKTVWSFKKDGTWELRLYARPEQ